MADEKKQEGTPEQAAAAAQPSLLDQLVETTKLKPGSEAFSITKQGLQAFITELLEPQRAVEKVTPALVDDMIKTLDQKLCKQVDAILHHPDFQKLESSWRSLKYLVDRTDFRENNKVQIMSVAKDKLLADFEDAPEVMKSGLYKTVYSAEYGQFGGQPFAAIVANYEFGPGTQDIALLEKCASVAAMAHAPFIAAAGAEFFGIENFSQLPNLKDLSAVFEMPQFTKWNSFRESEDARYVGLALPHFLLRVPYGAATVPAKKFVYNEEATKNEQFCWGNAAFAFASRLTDSFAKYRWSANIIGPQGGGAVEGLPIYNYEAMGEIQTKIPTEILVSERREFELAEQGFIALTMRKNSDNAAFFSANSCQKPKTFGQSKEGKEAELNYKLGTQLPYVFVVSRLAHYIKVLQRENIGTWKERGDLELELNNWLRQYVADMDNPAPGVRSRRPLRQAEIVVSDVEGDPGWYKVELKVRPHFKYMGASFTLSLVGKLEKQ
ncbi:MAG: type VI secretion system contractile sheath large subunit [Nitrospirota bacterium]|nr:type VI secretion system contractile sheath large subunit [Nitrospirota bacterium]MDE3224801.1 type VI secretion system contractile sheath large subunit [Nitrospirota bacterium]MDE3241462.1 type VI secretion system contractile sheath large subunit [Nitrospirota bacterium]